MNVALHPVRVLSLFSGGGGLDLGFHAATGGRSRTVCYVEREAYAAACLVARMEEAALDAAPVWDDVATFDGRAWRGAVDCVLGGSPCQDLSVAGKRAGIHGERSGLFWHQLRIAVECEAPIFAWENVGGAVGALAVVESALAEAGYRGGSVSIRASDVGAPHRRQRIFLLAYRNTSGRAVLGATQHDDRRDAPRHDVDGCDAGVGDADGARGQAGLSTQRYRRSRDTEIADDDCVGVFWFPPAPDDAEGWRDYLAAGGPAPTQPGLRRGADGVAAGLVDAVWADRLRLLGNGVVPQQAEAAFRFLMQHLETT